MNIFRSGACGVLVAMVAGCASQSPPYQVSSTPPSTLPATSQGNSTTQADMTKHPFMFNEAKLPKGYPAPGPVGQILVKHYPAARIALTRGGDQNDMFMPLFNHIKKHDIAMSSPVEITWSDPQAQPTQAKPEAMAFVYRDPDLGTPGTEGSVQVMDVPAQTFLSIGVRGSYDRQHLVEGVKKLREWLTAHATEYEAVGPPRYLGYNSPLVPWFMRFGEVQLPIRALEVHP